MIIQRMGGILVNTLEFSQRLIKVLDEDELQEVLKKAVVQGFSVQGFKNPWKAPKPAVTKGMERKKKGGEYYYEIILNAIANISGQSGSQSEAGAIAKQWLKIDNDNPQYEKIEKDLHKLEEMTNILDLNKKKTVSQYKVEKDDIIGENEKLSKRNEELQQRNKKLQLTLQGNKIEISNLKNDVTQNKKMYERVQINFEKKQKECDEYQKDYENAIKQVKEKNEYISLLLTKIGELERYKECAPKILCFSKMSTNDIDLSGYDITYAKDWEDAQKVSLMSQEYDEVWIIYKGFSFNDIKEIKSSASCLVKEFLNVERLKNKIGGRK